MQPAEIARVFEILGLTEETRRATFQTPTMPDPSEGLRTTFTSADSTSDPGDITFAELERPAQRTEGCR